MVGFQAITNGTVSALGLPASLPAGNADTITAALGVSPGKSGYDAIHGAALTGFFTYNEPSCGYVGGNSPNIGAALGGAALGSVPVVGGVLKTALGLFTAHHARAVKTEQATLCQAVPDANNFLRAIDQMIAAGQLSVTDAPGVLEQGYQNWRSEVAAILKDTGGKCNAACVYEKCFRAAIEKRKLDYASIAVQNTRGASGIVGGVVNLISGAAASVGSALASALPGAPASVPGVLPPGSLVEAGAVNPSNAGVFLIGGLVVVAILGFQILGGKNK